MDWVPEHRRSPLYRLGDRYRPGEGPAAEGCNPFPCSGQCCACRGSGRAQYAIRVRVRQNIRNECTAAVERVHEIRAGGEACALQVAIVGVRIKETDARANHELLPDLIGETDAGLNVVQVFVRWSARDPSNAGKGQASFQACRSEERRV